MNEAALQTEIERFGRLYVASSQVSHAVVRSGSQQELLDRVVRILVEAGRFAMAVVAWHDPATHQLVPVARFGDPKGYTDRIRVFGDDRPEGQGPSGTAFRLAKPYVCNDFLNDPHTMRWREDASESAWRASAAFPILIGGSPRGLLSVYSLEPGAFGPDQVELLEGVTLDVAFGIEHLEGVEQRRRAEAALFASERRLQLAMEAAALGSFDFDLRTGKRVWSEFSERMYGFEPGGFDGTYEAFAKRVHPDDLPKVTRDMDTARDSHGVFSHEFRVIWPDGSQHWLFGRGGFLYTDCGEPYRMYGAVVDVTERKRVEAALGESEERLRQAVRVSHIGIFDHDHVTDTVYWSPEMRAIYGWGPEEPVTLQAYLKCVYRADMERIAAGVKRAHDPAGDGLFDVEHRVEFPDGSIRWTSIRSQTFFDGEGAERRPARTIGAVRDITEQRQAEEEQKKLATLVAMNRDAIGIMTMEGRLVYLNHAAMTLFGVASIEEACLRTLFDLVEESDREQARADLDAALNRGYWSGEARIRNLRTGQPIDIEGTLFQIRDGNGAPLYIAAFARDIAERKRAEAEKAKLEEQLFQAQKMESIGRLAGGVAHDFNNLLTVINGYSQLALSELTPEDPLWSSMEEICKAGERAVGLTRQLLAFSRKQILQPRVLDLNRVVSDLRPMLERLMGEDVEVRVALDALRGTVRADPHHMEQVVMNLAVNARDAMPAGGRLLIETAAVELDGSYAGLHPEVNEGHYVMLAVSDSGLGMDEQTRRRIFEPFFTTKPVGKGTGLGLSTVQGIVAQSGGHISVDSEPGRGTTFKIYLPAVAGLAAEMGVPAGVAALGGNETVLVVEDMAEVRDYTVTALKAYGYRVIQAENAGEALLVCEREAGRIHLVLTDVVMPNVGGPELAVRLKERRPGIEVLLMSGYTDNAISINGALDEHLHFIEKPFSPDQLAKKVRAVLGPPGHSA